MEKENWYAMYVRMHHEKKVAEKLGQMGVNIISRYRKLSGNGATAARSCKWWSSR